MPRSCIAPVRRTSGPDPAVRSFSRVLGVGVGTAIVVAGVRRKTPWTRWSESGGHLRPITADCARWFVHVQAPLEDVSEQHEAKAQPPSVDAVRS
jgi:hypothetical protein